MAPEPEPLAEANRREDLEHLKFGRARAAMVGSFWSLINVLIATLVSTVVFLIASRFLTPSDFGVVALSVTIVSLVSCAIPIAFGEALVQRELLRPDHLDTVFWACVGFSVILFGLLCVSTPWIARVSNTQELRALLPFVGLRLIFDAFAVVPTALITRAVKFKSIAYRTTLANSVGGVACVLMVFYGMGFWALAVSQVLGSFVALLVIVPAARWWPGRDISRLAVIDLWNFGAFSFGNRIINEMRLDQMLIGFLGGPATLGLFFFARRIFQMFNDLTAGVFSPVSNVILASLQGDPTKRRTAFLMAGYASTSLAFPVFAGLLALADTTVPLVFGAQWTEAVGAVRGFSVIGLMAGLGIVQAALIRSQGRADWWFWYQAAMQASTAPIIIVLYSHGLTMVIAGLALRTVVLWPLSVRMTMQIVDMSFATYFNSLRGPIFGSAAMVAVMLAVDRFVPLGTDHAVLFVQISAGVAIYLMVMGGLSWRQAHGIFIMIKQRKVAQ